MHQPPFTRAVARFALAAGAAVAATALAAGAAADPPAAVARATTTVLEDQSFEGAFPPGNWQILDYGVPPGQYLWGRTTCSAPSGGGTASVWSVGGGTLGGGLACDGEYEAHAESDLVFGPIDASGFEGGLDVTAHIKLDLHRATDFQICITNPGAPGGVSCFGAGVTQLDWNYFDPPIAFPQAAGMAEVYVLLRFRDRDPEAGALHQGAFVDRVVIRGLSDGLPPTATTAATTAAPTATTTAAATTTATAPPSATATSTASATAVATASPTQAASATTAPSVTPTITPPPTATGAATAAPSPTATRTATVPATTIAPSATPSGQPSATATPTLPAPPTVVGVTSTPTPTSEPSSTPGATATAPPGGTATATPTVIVAPPEPRIYLPYAYRRRLP